MAETKYGKYFSKEPWGKSAQPDSKAPAFIAIGEDIAAKDGVIL